jgi:hypothetical protein
MNDSESIYFSRVGKNILNPTNYPKEVKEYLNDEYEFIKTLMYNFNGLIEIGCFDATYALLCSSLSKHYIGIDIVPEYIEEANHKLNFWSLDNDKFEVLNLDAHSISELPLKSNIYKNLPSKEWLIFFPFNCLGNLPNPTKVIEGLKTLKSNSFISTFNVSKKSTEVRKEYYSNCEIINLKIKALAEGIRFTSSEKFSSIAYTNTWIFKHLSGLCENTSYFNLGSVGVAVLNSNFLIDETEMPSFSN